MTDQNHLKNILNEEFNAYVREFKTLLPKLNESELKFANLKSSYSNLTFFHCFLSRQKNRNRLGDKVERLQCQNDRHEATQCHRDESLLPNDVVCTPPTIRQDAQIYKSRIRRSISRDRQG